MQGNRVIGEAAIRAGCKFYAGYPITPQNELTEYMAENMRRVEGGVFIQGESEIASINMVTGASVAGARAMTSSSSPGISLKQEGISALAADELPAVIVNIMRGSPGLGNISPSQGDYFQATRGGGHGGLSRDRSCPGIGPGTGGPDDGCLRSGGYIPHTGDDPRRWHDGADDGTGRFQETKTTAISRQIHSQRLRGGKGSIGKRTHP